MENAFHILSKPRYQEAFYYAESVDRNCNQSQDLNLALQPLYSKSRSKSRTTSVLFIKELKYQMNFIWIFCEVLDHGQCVFSHKFVIFRKLFGSISYIKLDYIFNSFSSVTLSNEYDVDYILSFCMRNDSRWIITQLPMFLKFRANPVALAYTILYTNALLWTSQASFIYAILRNPDILILSKRVSLYYSCP
jgi:hypothetical protein